MTKIIRRYSDAFKRSVVAEVESGRYTVMESARVHQLGFGMVYRWVKQFGGPDSQTRIMRFEMPNERDRIKELEKRNRELESAVEVWEEQSGRAAKKKPATLPSNAPGPKDSA